MFNRITQCQSHDSALSIIVDYVIITSIEQTENMDIRSLTDLSVQTFEADDCDRIESGSLG